MAASSRTPINKLSKSKTSSANRQLPGATATSYQSAPADPLQQLELLKNQITQYHAELDKYKKAAVSRSPSEGSAKLIPRPAKVTKLVDDMQLTDQKDLYNQCRHLVKDRMKNSGIQFSTLYKDIDPTQLTDAVRLARADHPQLRMYESDWALYEIMRGTLRNCRSNRIKSKSSRSSQNSASPSSESSRTVGTNSTDEDGDGLGIVDGSAGVEDDGGMGFEEEGDPKDQDDLPGDGNTSDDNGNNPIHDGEDDDGEVEGDNNGTRPPAVLSEGDGSGDDEPTVVEKHNLKRIGSTRRPVAPKATVPAQLQQAARKRPREDSVGDTASTGDVQSGRKERVGVGKRGGKAVAGVPVQLTRRPASQRSRNTTNDAGQDNAPPAKKPRQMNGGRRNNPLKAKQNVPEGLE